MFKEAKKMIRNSLIFLNIKNYKKLDLWICRMKGKHNKKKFEIKINYSKAIGKFERLDELEENLEAMYEKRMENKR